MPALEQDFRCQDAVLWPFLGNDRYGKPMVDWVHPQELKVRWDDAVTEATQPQSLVDAEPTDVIVDRAIIIGSLMRLGTLDSVPSPPDNLRRVTSYNAVPDVRGREVRRSVKLIRHVGPTQPVQ
jgi:hypothetical protein